MSLQVISVLGREIKISQIGSVDYICLTDMVQGMEDGDQLIKKWLSNKNTIEFLGVWERIYNPDFNLSEFGQVKNDAGTNRFTMSVKKWVEITNGISLKARSGRYGSGTYAHKDVAFEFGIWLSPEFKLLLIKEFERLKEQENKGLLKQWDVRRFLAKTNYHNHTSAVKDKIIPLKKLPIRKEGIAYADEAELLNLALFGISSAEWRSQNPELSKGNLNMRDYANTHQLIVLSNLESLNAMLLNQNVINKEQRFNILSSTAERELLNLSKYANKENPLISSPLIKSDKENNQIDDSTESK